MRRNWIIGVLAGGLTLALIAGWLWLERGGLLAWASPGLPESPTSEEAPYHLVYLFSGEGDPSDPLAPTHMEAALNARTATRWSDVLTYHEQRPIDALLIHRSAFETVDWEWVSRAYHYDGMVIGLMDATYEEFVNLVRAPCLSPAAFREEEGTRGVAAYQIVVGDEPEEVEFVKNAYYTGICGPDAYTGTSEYVATSRGEFYPHITSADSLIYLKESVYSLLDDREEFRHRYEQGRHQGAPPTDVRP